MHRRSLLQCSLQRGGDGTMPTDAPEQARASKPTPRSLRSVSNPFGSGKRRRDMAVGSLSRACSGICIHGTLPNTWSATLQRSLAMPSKRAPAQQHSGNLLEMGSVWALASAGGPCIYPLRVSGPGSGFGWSTSVQLGGALLARRRHASIYWATDLGQRKSQHHESSSRRRSVA